MRRSSRRKWQANRAGRHCLHASNGTRAGIRHLISTFVVWLTLVALGHAALEKAPDPIDPMPDAMKNVGQLDRIGAQVPLDLPFVDSDGSPAALRKFFDGTLPIIVTLNYSNCPRLCSLQLNGLFEGLQKLDYSMGEKYRMITVSLDPEESPARAEATKQKYLAAYGREDAAQGWRCLVGEERNIRALADAVGFQYAEVPDQKPKQYAHEAVTIICTPDGRVSRYLRGIEYDPKTLRLALLEASDGKIGTFVDQFPLVCFAYDAESGSYRLAAVKVMRLGGILTVLVLGGVLLVFWRYEMKGRGKMSAAASHDPATPVQGQISNSTSRQSQSSNPDAIS